MKGYSILYFLGEGIKNIFIHKFMSFACVTVIVACLIITGSFSLVAVNVNVKIDEAVQSNEVLVYVDSTLSDQEALALGTKLYAVTNVKSATFVTNDEALEDLHSVLGEYADLLEGFDGQNFQHRYRVLLEDLTDMQATTARLEQVPGVAEVDYSVELLDAVLSMQNAVNIISYILAAILVLVSLFIISNTVKMATFARREEIAIMKIVGATNAFIRWPFVVEGFLLGVIGGVAAFFCQWGVYTYASDLILEYTHMGGMLELLSFTEVAPVVAITFLAAGFLVGVGGGVLTIRKFMRV